MDYDVIIIGATFCAVGMLQVYGDKCLVLERRPQAGYEFLNAMKFGKFDKEPKSGEGKDFLKKLKDKGLFTEYGVNFFDAASTLYSYLVGKNVLLNMEIVSTEKIEGGFKVICCGVSGIREFTAAKVIDTTPRGGMIAKKSINFLAVPLEENSPPISDFGGMRAYPSGMKLDRICKVDLSLDADYIEARKKIYDITVMDEFKGYRLEFVADSFDITTKGSALEESGGIIYLTSCAYDNGIDAFDAGVVYAKGGNLQ